MRPQIEFADQSLDLEEEDLTEEESVYFAFQSERPRFDHDEDDED